MKIRRKIYLTDRDDNGKLFGRLIAVDDDYSYEVELAPQLRVISDDGKSRFITDGPESYLYLPPVENEPFDVVDEAHKRRFEYEGAP